MSIVKLVIEFVMDILETVVFIGSLFIVIYLFILQPNQVKGASMEPTFISGEYILTSKVTYKFRPMHRGDVIVFKSLQNPNIDYIKRIIGLPGDRVTVTAGEVYVNDQRIAENYIASKTNVWERGYSKEGIPATVPDGQIFVMGDNRGRSSDSREFGPVPIENIIGQVFFRYFPVNKIGWIGNPLARTLQTLNLNTLFAFPVFKFFHQTA